MSDEKKTPAWKAAELLEEIAKKADPLAIMQKIARTKMQPATTFSVLTDPGADGGVGSITVKYFYPIDTSLRDVEGTPEDIVAWLSTGLGPDQSAYVERMSNGAPGVVIQQIHREKWMIDDMIEMNKRWQESILRRHSQ